jgi:hypothetical protein
VPLERNTKEDAMAEQQPRGQGTPELQSLEKAKRPQDDDGLQGEGNYEAARRYRDELEEFVKTADIDKAAHDAAPKDQREADELAAAEAKGRARRK